MKKIILVGIACVAVSLMATETTWTGVSGGDWSTSSNWSAGVPGSADTAVFKTAVIVTPPDTFSGTFFINAGVEVTAAITGTSAFTLRTAGDSSKFTKTGSGCLTLTPYRRLTRGSVTAAEGTLVLSGPGTSGDPGAFDKVIVKAGAAASVVNSAVATRHGVIVRYGKYVSENTTFAASTLDTPALFDTAWDSHFNTQEATRGEELRLVTSANPLLQGSDIIPSACVGQAGYDIAFRGIMFYDFRNFGPSFTFIREAGSRGGIYLLSYNNGWRQARADDSVTSRRNIGFNFTAGDYGWGSLDMAIEIVAASAGGMSLTRNSHVALRENGVIDDALIWYGACCNDLTVESGASFNVPAGQAFAVGDASMLTLNGSLTGEASSCFAIMGGNATGSSKTIADSKFAGLSGFLELGRPAGLKLTAAAATASYTIVGYGQVWLSAEGTAARVSPDYAGIVSVPAGQSLAVPESWGTAMEFHGVGTLSLADIKHTESVRLFQGRVSFPAGATIAADTLTPAAAVTLSSGSALKIGNVVQLAGNNPDRELCAPYTDATAWTYLGKMHATERIYESVTDPYKNDPPHAYVNKDGDLQLTDDGGQVRAAYLNRAISREDVFDAAFTYTLDHANLPEGGEESYQQWAEGGAIVLQCNGLTNDTGLNSAYTTGQPLNSFGISMNTFVGSGLRWIYDGLVDDIISGNDGVTISTRSAIDFKLHYEAGILRVEARQDDKVWVSARDISYLFDKGKDVYFGFVGRSGHQNNRTLFWINTRVSDLTIAFRKAPLPLETAGGNYAFTADNYQLGYHSEWAADGTLTLLPGAMNKQGKAVLKTPLSARRPFTVAWTMNYGAKGSAGMAQGSSFTLQAKGADETIYDSTRGNGGIPKTECYGMLMKVFDAKGYVINGGFSKIQTPSTYAHYSGQDMSENVRVDYDGAGNFTWRMEKMDGSKVSETKFSTPDVLKLGNVYPSFFGNQSWNSEMYLATSLTNVVFALPPDDGYAVTYAGGVSVAGGATAGLKVASYGTSDTAKALTVESVTLAADSTLQVSPEDVVAKVALADLVLSGNAGVTAMEGAVVRLETIDMTAAAAVLAVRGKVEFGETLTVKIPDSLKKLDSPVKIVDLSQATIIGTMPTTLTLIDAEGNPAKTKLKISSDGIYVKPVGGMLVIVR